MSSSSQIKPGETSARSTAKGIPSQYRRFALLFCIATFFFWVGLYLYVPVLPVYAQTLGASLTVVGLIVASYGLPQMLFRIPIGLWSDALGKRKPFMAMGISMGALGALGLWLSPNPWFLLLSRAIVGVGAATWVNFTVYFASFYPEGGTGRAMGIISFVNSAAIVVATAAGGLVAEYQGFSGAFIGAVLSGIVALAFLLPVRSPAQPEPRALSLSGFSRVVTHPMLLTVSIMGILVQFAQFSVTFGFLPLYGTVIGASKADLGIITMLAMGSGALGALSMAYIAGRFGNSTTIILGSVVAGATMVMVPFIQSVHWLEVNQLISGFGRGILTTSLMSLAIEKIAPQQRATAMGVYQAVYAVGMLVGPIVSGLLADGYGLDTVFYLGAALFLAIIGMAFLPIMRKS